VFLKSITESKVDEYSEASREGLDLYLVTGCS
jgi:hypothetical protein